MSDELPGFWMCETSGVLRPAVEAYLKGDDLSATQIAALRAYLRQWIMADVWLGGRDIDWLRARIDDLHSRTAIDAWLYRANELMIDPL